MTELWGRSALELAGAIRDGETCSKEVLEALRRRIEEVNGDLNAIVAVLGAEADAAAEAADRAVAEGAALGALHGLPITVKENIDVAGSATTQGVVALADAIPALDAPVVERMGAAGAYPFARTNLPDFGLRVHTDSSLRGLTRNPWNPDVTAGGSSGGEASALAAGMSVLGLGNDLGGSLRNPAHCCGIASIKPSSGVVPDASALPPEDPGIMIQLMAVQGVMARHVADLRAGLLALAGPHWRDPGSLPVTLGVPDGGSPLRVAVLAEPPGGTTDAGVAGVVRHTADVLAAAGHRVEEAAPASYERCVELWGAMLLPDIAAIRMLLDPLMGEDGRAFLEHAEARYPTMDATAWAYLFAERHGAARQWAAFFLDWDVLLSPTWAAPPFAHGADIASADGALAALETMRPVMPANLLGLPAAVVPGGVVDGLPVGVQLTGARFGDLTALAAAEVVERVVGVMTPITPFPGHGGR